MKKLLSLLTLFFVSLGIALAGVRLTVPISKDQHLVVPRSSMVISTSEGAPAAPATPTDDERCVRGEWRACLELAEQIPARRGELTKRAEALLDRQCHGAVVPAHLPPTTKLQACGELAALRMERSPRHHLASRECLETAVLDCDSEGLGELARRGGVNTDGDRVWECDLADELPTRLLERPEWSAWCDQGHAFSCRVHEASLWVSDPT